jgi:hypothetical protein
MMNSEKIDVERLSAVGGHEAIRAILLEFIVVILCLCKNVYTENGSMRAPKNQPGVGRVNEVRSMK